MNFAKHPFAQTALVTAMLVAASSAHAGQVFSFDPTGNANTTGGAIDITTFDWTPDNALVLGAFSTLPLAFGGPTPAVPSDQQANEIYVQVLTEGRLAGFLNPSSDNSCATAIQFCAGFYNREFTFQFSAWEFIKDVGNETTTFRLAPGDSFYRIYADTSKNANVTTGNGYADGTLIFEARVSTLTGTFTSFSAQDPVKYPVGLLDKNGVDNQRGTLTTQGTGNNSFGFQVTYLDTNYFRTQVVGGNDTSSLSTAFNQVNPSDKVVGVTPAYSKYDTDPSSGVTIKRVNGTTVIGDPNSCGPLNRKGQTETGVNVARCDFHIQTDASTSFLLEVPEPPATWLVAFGLVLLPLAHSFRTSRRTQA
ncbi:MAG: hypothetical protein KF778_04570 [Rhodocyclaceae bacterium]|nr:hypothetical protein [Rhodocyclaceae bacterium]MBX3667657.1 hypothetical protein [Rhodocyclaceae bacterium]